jgi:WD40 repeat protein
MFRSAATWTVLALGACGTSAQFAVAAPPPSQPAGVRSVAFSPNGKFLAVTTGQPKQPGTITLWEVATRKQVWKHIEDAGIPAVAFASGGQQLAIAIHANAAKVLNVGDGTVRSTLNHPQEARAVAFSPDGKRLATGCGDKLVRVWDLATGTETLTCTGHRDRIFAVAFSPDGKQLVSVAGPDGAKVWSATTGVEQHSLRLEYMVCARFTPDGRGVLTGSYESMPRLWAPATGEQRLRFTGTAGVIQLAFSEAAHTLAVIGYGREFTLFDLTLRKPTADEVQHVRELLARLDDDSYEVREATGRKLLEVGIIAEAELQRAAREAKSAEVRIRARQLRQELLSRPKAVLRGHTDLVEGLDISPDGKLLASGGKDGTVRLWDLKTLKETACWVSAP